MTLGSKEKETRTHENFIENELLAKETSYREERENQARGAPEPIEEMVNFYSIYFTWHKHGRMSFVLDDLGHCNRSQKPQCYFERKFN